MLKRIEEEIEFFRLFNQNVKENRSGNENYRLFPQSVKEKRRGNGIGHLFNKNVKGNRRGMELVVFSTKIVKRIEEELR